MDFAIEVKNLKKDFGKFSAVKGISFSIERNHIVGFLGPNGAGKTTTIRTIVGLNRATSGLVKVCGETVNFGQSNINHKIGYLPELPSFYNWMSGEEYLDFIADTFGINQDLKRKRIDELLELTGLISAKNRKIGGYSNGMKQRLGIAQSLVHDPEVLILDEPVSSLDPVGRVEIIKIIESLKNSKTIFLSTHILTDVDRICDDIIIINHGRKIADSSLVQLKNKYANPILEIDFISDPKKYIDFIKAENWVKSVDQNNCQLKVTISDPKVIETNKPIKLLSRLELGILNYDFKLPTTEDLFVKLLEENDCEYKSN